jgi:hypothetical protein
MSKILNDSVKREIASHAKEFPTEEVCGVVVDGKIIKLPNLAADKENHFQIDLSWLALVPDALYHSHWSDSQPGEFSLDDLEMCRGSKDSIPWILCHSAFGEWDYYDPSSPNPFPLKMTGDSGSPDFYLNWRFVWGRTDCFELVRCYYLGMLDIDIGNFSRPTPEDFPTPNWLTPWKAEEHGFLRVADGESVLKNDIVQIALKGGNYPNHIGVIVDGERMLILHNLSAEYTSQIGLYGSYWQQRTTHIFRHESLWN